MELIRGFENYIKSDFYYFSENQNWLELSEEKGKQYKVVVKVDKEISKLLVIHNLEILKKENALYLKQHPKDCDYIILDLIDKIVYVIELKDTEISNSSFMKQLKAGEYWLDHLLFCCQMVGYTEDWDVKRVGIRYDSGRPKKARRARIAEPDDNILTTLKYIKDVGGHDIYLFRGKELHLSSLTH
ncbi:hypothetical protein SFC02_11870 [Terribacillus goriensis]|uniref:hypothetical protein n=1 Tax=Terribacillus saccharophilus TaxID=361277 RepID=UPI0039837A65